MPKKADGTPLTDADVMDGGLGGTDGGAADDKGKKGKAAADAGGGESPKTVSVGGVEFPAEIGDKLNMLVEGFTKEITHLKGQVQTLSTLQQPAPKKGADDDDDDDINTKIFENPKEALNKLLGKFEKKVAAMIAESSGKVEAKHMAASQEKQFWETFYGDNPELKDHDFIVKALLQRDFAKLASKTVDEAIKHIATEAKKLLLKSGVVVAKGGAKSEEVEGAGGRPGAGAKPGKEADTEVKVEPETLSGFLKQRREARRAGGANKTA